MAKKVWPTPDEQLSIWPCPGHCCAPAHAYICKIASVCQDRTGHAGLCVERVPVRARQLRVREAHRQPPEAREVPLRRVRNWPAHAPHQIAGPGPAHAVLQRGQARKGPRHPGTALQPARLPPAHQHPRGAAGRARHNMHCRDRLTGVGTLHVSTGPARRRARPGPDLASSRAAQGAAAAAPAQRSQM